MLKNKKMTIFLSLFALVLLVCAVTFAAIEQTNAKDQAKKIQAEQTSSKTIAKAGLETAKKQYEKMIQRAYDETMTRYDQLSSTDQKGFEVDRIFYARAHELLKSSIGKEQISTDYNIVRGNEPTTSTLLSKNKEDRYTLETTAKVGNNETTISQSFDLELKVPVTKTNKIYNYQYAVHATKQVVAKNGSKIVGNVASTHTKDIQVDASSCQYVQDKNGYYNTCYNDGNTDASPLKMRNAQSFNTYLPTFPSKDLEAFDSLPITTDEQYLPIPKEDLYKEVEEKDGTIRKVKKTDEELEPLKIYYVQDGALIMDSTTESAFTTSKPYRFNDSEVHFSSIVTDGIDATIDIGDGDQVIRVDSLSLLNGATLTVQGSGTLKLFIKDYTDTSGQIVADQAAVETYIDGKQALEFDAGFTSPGLLYVKSANITLPGDGGFQGNIITGAEKLTFSGGENTFNQLILAPKATVVLKDDVVFHGSMIAKNVLLDEATLIFSTPDEAIPIPLAVEKFDTPIQLIKWGAIETAS